MSGEQKHRQKKFPKVQEKKSNITIRVSNYESHREE